MLWYSTASIKVDITQVSIAPFTFQINGTTYLGTNYNDSVQNISDLTYTFNNLVAGTYSVTVTDANGNSKTTLTKTITQPENPLSIASSIQDIDVQGNDGEIDVTVSGGTLTEIMCILTHGQQQMGVDLCKEMRTRQV